MEIALLLLVGAAATAYLVDHVINTPQAQVKRKFNTYCKNNKCTIEASQPISILKGESHVSR